MKANDDDIKKALQNNIQRINDDSFTKSVVGKHLADQEIIKYSYFENFLPMIIGLSIIIISIGFVLLMKQNNNWITEIGLTENQGLIILAISIIFSIYKLMEEFTAPNTRSYAMRGDVIN